MTDICGVYLIRNKIDGKIYVGSSCRIYRRLHDHVTGYGSLHVYRAVEKYGRDAFDVQVLEVCTRENLSECEAQWMTMLRPEYNFVLETVSAGRVFSDATRARMSIAKPGKPSPRLGQSHTLEARAKISAAHKGRTLSAEHRANIALAGRGRIMPPDVRKKISVSHMGMSRKLRPEERAARSIIMRARWADPEHRARLIAGIKKGD